MILSKGAKLFGEHNGLRQRLFASLVGCLHRLIVGSSSTYPFFNALQPQQPELVRLPKGTWTLGPLGTLVVVCCCCAGFG